MVDDVGGNDGSVLVRESCALDIFGEGICDAQDELLPVCQYFKGPKQVGMNPLIRLGGLRHFGHNVRQKGGWFLHI